MFTDRIWQILSVAQNRGICMIASRGLLTKRARPLYALDFELVAVQCEGSERGISWLGKGLAGLCPLVRAFARLLGPLPRLLGPLPRLLGPLPRLVRVRLPVRGQS